MTLLSFFHLVSIGSQWINFWFRQLGKGCRAADNRAYTWSVCFAKLIKKLCYLHIKPKKNWKFFILWLWYGKFLHKLSSISETKHYFLNKGLQSSFFLIFIAHSYLLHATTFHIYVSPSLQLTEQSFPQSRNPLSSTCIPPIYSRSLWMLPNSVFCRSKCRSLYPKIAQTPITFPE